MRFAIALWLALVALAAPAILAQGAAATGAQQPGVAAPDQAGGDGYEPVSSVPPAQETLPAAPLVMAAYAFVWLMVVVYLWTIWRRLGAVERELSGVARRVDDLQRR